jgi:predicted ABC-type ATPase
MHILDQAFIFDNSSTQPELIFEIRAGKVITRAETLPLRAADLLE